jgi:hypothetical protein
MALVIAGHIRSGTTLLRNLCHAHPEIAVTMEFGCFRGLGTPSRDYTRRLLHRCWRRRFHSFLIQGKEETRWKNRLASYGFVARFLYALNQGSNTVDAGVVESALCRGLSTSGLVGDKDPDYTFLLDELADIEGLVRIMIYRDCRDVTRSVLERISAEWRDKPYAPSWDSVEKIAVKWVDAIDRMERHRDKLLVVRYEDLVREPEPTFVLLGKTLGVDPAGFARRMVFDTSIGKHKGELAEKDLATLLDIAGPAMSRLGYL